MQAITTRYLGATDHRPSRILAKCPAGHLTLPYDDALSEEAAHAQVAHALIQRLGWDTPAYGAWHCGGLSTGYVFVCAPKELHP